MVLITSEINRHQVIHRFILFMSNTVPLKGAIRVFFLSSFYEYIYLHRIEQDRLWTCIWYVFTSINDPAESPLYLS
jgi:hypothetical protein